MRIRELMDLNKGCFSASITNSLTGAFTMGEFNTIYNSWFINTSATVESFSFTICVNEDNTPTGEVMLNILTKDDFLLDE